MSTSQEVKISVKRQRLSARIEKFHSNGQAFFKGLEINGAFTPQDDPEYCGKEEEEEEEGDRMKGTGKFLERKLRSWERELRIGQANDCLDQLRFGQGTSKLAWFWMMDGEQSQLSLQGGGLMEEFYRINWLKARAIQMEWLSQLDPEDWEDEIAIIQKILALAFTGKNKEDAGEGENAREEKARPTKAGDYKKAFTAFTAAQWVFKEEMDSYDRERRDTNDHKTIGQRTRIVQQWWESLSDDQKAEAGRAVEKWNKLGAPKETHDLKNLPAMAKDFIETVQKTMGSHVVMFVGHESGEGQIKLAVFETAPGDGKKVFTESSQSSKDWVLTAESILTDYLLTEPVEEDSAEKQEVEISLDEDGNPKVPTWGGQKLKVQQNLARAVFQAAYVLQITKFTKKPKTKVPWGLLIKSPMEYLDSESIPEGFTIKDPSTWTKADLGLLWDHWQSLEAEEKVIVSFIDCKNEDAPLSRQFDRKVVGSSKKRVWGTVDDDSEAEVGGAGIPGPSATQHSVGGPSEQTVDGGEVLGEATTDAGKSNPEESSPAWHASKGQISYLKSLSIMPRYQVLVDLVDALPEQEHGKGPEVDFPYWVTWTWSAKYLPEEIHLDLGTFQKAIGELQSARCSSSSRGLEVVLGLGLLLRECSHAQEVEEDDPLVSKLNFLLNSKLGVQRGDDVMDVVGVVVSRLEQCPAGLKGAQGGDGGAGMGKSDGGYEEKEKEEEEAPPRKRKRAGSGIVTRGQKMAKKDEGKGKKVGIIKGRK
ncbi:hypothetical protein F5141DRAFT_1263235 [Pisolithus sp. B1]|nr:hypothetical protein F5141DRAFT_1263235 [Pisolithus sp. B1]